MIETSGTDLEDKVLTFQVGSETYGVPLAWVCAVEAAGQRGDGNDGNHVFKGERVPCIDLAVFFSCSGPPGESLLILGRGEAEAAALVDNPGVLAASREVYKLPEICQSFTGDTFSGALVIDDRIILMVDPERLCREGDGVNVRIGGGGDGQ